jgi:SPP1 gp7 family putative phage head morphogenesis protein
MLQVMLNLAGLLDGITDPFEIIDRIRAFAHTKAFSAYAEATAMKMVTHLFSDSGRTWRQAARANGQGRMIYEALLNEMRGPMGGAVRHQIGRNAAIIKSLPLNIASSVTEHIMTESMKGKRASDIAQEIQLLFPEKSKAKASLIARTEVSKTSTAITQARSELVGIKAYVWRTSEDERVRASHKHMKGIIIAWDDPPSPEELDGEKHTYGHYHAGDIFNCRCYPEPIIDLDLIKWPAKIYYGGSIQRMTRKQFEGMM